MGFGGGKGGGAAAQPAIEPVKSAEEAMKSAGDASARAQQLKRGIASTFNRPTAFAAPSGGATSGAASKLGG